MRRALVIGIDKYKDNELDNCVNDALSVAELLDKNEDGSPNFDVVTLLDYQATKDEVLKAVDILFLGEDVDVALLYFSGHGLDDDDDCVIVTYDYSPENYCVRMEEILDIANQSTCQNKIIILDCCKSGWMGKTGVVGDNSVLSNGMTILTATSEKGLASDGNRSTKHGAFTYLLIEALRGGAYDILGRVTPGSIYAYIDQALGAWDQRPIFKTNISRFIVLREGQPKIDKSILRKLITYFNSPNDELKLDPSYEETNIEGGYHLEIEPYAKDENVVKLKELQKYNRNGLLIPKSVNHMYDVAMKSEVCVLTPLGKHYWNLVKKKKI